MLLKLFLLFVTTTTLELFLLLELARRLGVGATIGVILATALAGSVMVKSQGLRILARMREETARGVLPTDPILEGVMILVAGALLLTPGVLTDAVGLLLLLPPVRVAIREQLKRFIKRRIDRGTIDVHFEVSDKR
jgi:UPF0716 protein FxsA